MRNRMARLKFGANAHSSAEFYPFDNGNSTPYFRRSMRSQAIGTLMIPSFFKHVFVPIAAFALAIVTVLNTNAANPFAEHIRSTPPLDPSEELKSFRLPPGFEIQLVASEPDIAKPMNMAFDAKGRLWVTVTREYPFPVSPGQPARDEIKILDDFDETGRARKITTFVDGLNIPIGLYPYKNGVIAWSIPNIWYFQDTDGDGKADKREILFGPLGWERDTHGMNSSFSRGYDGWLYLTHGYNNNSTVRGKDGSEIQMNSGNVYRIRLDGSRVEQYSWGQVNPFGLCFDPLGNLFSADCHSEPVFQLLRGAYYPSFGKPHDGLGFGPSMIFHSHESTAISGIVYYSDDRWPAEYRHNIFTGNVMTSAVNRDLVVNSGSTPTAAEKPDFIRTDDPWFRPVNLQLGPDGALYVADFYNRIIGHYEVPLQHPGRDRERGRIWRVVYSGNTASKLSESESGPASDRTLPNTIEGLIRELGNANLTHRILAMNRLSDEFGQSSVEPLRVALASTALSAPQTVHALWTLYRLNRLDPAILENAASHQNEGVRTHAMRILSETAAWPDAFNRLARQALQDSDAVVKRAAADAMGQHPSFENIQPLLELRHSVPPSDTHLLHTVRMALRNQLKNGDSLNRLRNSDLNQKNSQTIADVALGLQSSESGSFLLKHVRSHEENKASLNGYMRHIARYAPRSDQDTLIEFARNRLSGDNDLQLALLKSIQAGTAQRGDPVSEKAQDWGYDLAKNLLNSVDQSRHSWINNPIEGMRITTNPWILQTRRSSDGDRTSTFLSSLPQGGEQMTGILRSKNFTIPGTLRFFVAGHDGSPERKAQKRNAVRLFSKSGKLIAEEFAPRNDIAQQVEWDLKAHEGNQGYIEIVDEDTGSAFAWLAAGRFEPPVVPIPAISPSEISQRRQAAADLGRSLKLTSLEPRLRNLLEGSNSDLATCAVAAQAIVAMKPNESAASVASIISDASVPANVRRTLSRALAKPGVSDFFPIVKEALRVAPYRIQKKLAQSLAGSLTGAQHVFELIENAQASPRLLMERPVRDRLSVLTAPSVRNRIAELTRDTPPINIEIQRLIDQRRNNYSRAIGNPENGASIFGQACSVCHQIDRQGGLLAPQLDGIGNRGLERLLEDVLDPNRNVDPAFHTTIVTLKDGELVTGLFRREEGAYLVFANSAGVEISVSKSDIAERRIVETSLMPENFGEALVQEDLGDLMAYLLSKKGAQAQVEE